MKKKRRGERGNERGGKGGKGEMKNKGEVRGERKYGDRRGIRGEGRGGGPIPYVCPCTPLTVALSVYSPDK